MHPNDMPPQTDADIANESEFIEQRVEQMKATHQAILKCIARSHKRMIDTKNTNSSINLNIGDHVLVKCPKAVAKRLKRNKIAFKPWEKEAGIYLILIPLYNHILLVILQKLKGDFYKIQFLNGGWYATEKGKCKSNKRWHINDLKRFVSLTIN